MDGVLVPKITAYLVQSGGDENPFTLGSNRKLAFKGCEIGSLGYLISASDPRFDEFSKLNDPRHGSVQLLKPYIGGEDLNANAAGGSNRYVLDVDGLQIDDIKKLPGLLAYLEERVRSDFLKRGEIKTDTVDWWHFRRPSIELRKVVGRFPRVLAMSRVSSVAAFSFISGDAIANSDVICFQFQSLSSFSAI